MLGKLDLIARSQISIGQVIKRSSLNQT